MKRTTLLLLAVLTALSTCFTSFAKNDDETEAIPIHFNEPGDDDQHTVRGPAIVPVEVTLNHNLSTLNIAYLYNVGVVDILITNNTTNEITAIEVDSILEQIDIAVLSGWGSYTIEFQTEDGASYIGSFILW